MEPKFQTSFIPKKPIVSGQGSGIKVVRSANIFSLIATIFFIVTVIISGALFVYKRVLLDDIEKAKLAVDNADKAIQSTLIKDLIDTNSRIVATKNLLDKHIAVSKLLSKLESLTIKKVRFTELSYKNQETGSVLLIKAEAQNYNALAQQENAYSTSDFLVNPQFSNFILTDNGGITVDFTSNINPSTISYKESLESTPTQ